MIELSRSQVKDAITLLEKCERRKSMRKIFDYYPESGDFRRSLYLKHMDFFAAGAKYRQRLMLAANRVGKTESVGLYELSLHLTGNYPDWWVGRKFDKPIKAWVAGDTKQTVREILQAKLLGPVGAWGTGVLQGEQIIKITRSGGGVADSVDSIHVKHKSGGQSTVTMKSYDQGRVAYQGTEQDVILLDEEPPGDIYIECLTRTMTNNGMIMLTFTPLTGMSDVVLSFLANGEMREGAQSDTKYVVTATWDDVPHLDEKVKAQMLADLPPFQRDARSKGVPQLGAGAIYPVPESDIVVSPFEIPDHWPKCYGLDVGWNRTAAIWGALDRENECVYLFSEHYRGEAEPVVHAESIKTRGDWIPGVIDPAANGRSQKDGSMLIDCYINFGLDVQNADNSVESGIYNVWSRLSAGKLKVFSNLSNWLSEYRLYRRDEKGKIVKERDHLMDATRYLVVSGLDRVKTKPIKQQERNEYSTFGQKSMGWMG